MKGSAVAISQSAEIEVSFVAISRALALIERV